MNTPKMKPFDKEDVLDEEVLPLIRKAIDICNEHGIPYFIDFVYSCHDPEGDTVEHCTSVKNDREERDRFVGPYNLMLRLLRGEDPNEEPIRKRLEELNETWGEL